MKTSLLVKTVMCLSFLLPVAVSAQVRREYTRWARGDFEVPPEMSTIADASEVRQLLSSKDEFTRMAAARRLGDLEGPGAIPYLVGAFAGEPPITGSETLPLVRLEIVRTLSRTGSTEAKSALLLLLNDYWQKGPNVEDKKRFRSDRDFTIVVPLLLQTLYQWAADPNVSTVVEKIALSEDVRDVYRYRNGIGQRAWEVYLQSTMIRQGVVEETASATYLFNFIEDIRNAGLHSMPLGTLKREAARILLQRHSETTLSSMIGELEAQFKRKPSGPDGFLTERQNVLRRQIGYMKKLLEEKRRRSGQE